MIAKKADRAAAAGDNRSIFQFAKRAAGVRAQELKVVEWEDGSLTVSKEDYARRFQDHFGKVFGAKVVQSLEANESNKHLHRTSIK